MFVLTELRLKGAITNGIALWPHIYMFSVVSALPFLVQVYTLDAPKILCGVRPLGVSCSLVLSVCKPSYIRWPVSGVLLAQTPRADC